MGKMARQWKMILLALALGIAVAGPAASVQAQGKRLKVLTSTTILLDFARNVAGDKADLASIVPTDGDPHEFEPTPNDIKQLANADLILVNGLGLETFLDRLIQDSGTKASFVTLSNGIAIRRFGASGDAPAQGNLPAGVIGFGGQFQCGASGECDPHTWQDPTNVILYVLNIRDALIAADTANADTYRANAALYVAQLQQLDSELWQGLAAIQAKYRVLVTNHEALGYFAAHYGFKVVGVVLPGGVTGDEARPQDVAELVKAIKAQNVPAIFTENVANDKLASEVAAQTGVKVVQALYTDALGAPGTPGETYLGMMRANLKTIVGALGPAQ